MTEKLLPCPFCGGEPEYDRTENSAGSVHSISCVNERCGAAACVANGDADAAFASWNTRPTGWQPIETAPMDGTPILGWSIEGVSYVCWHDRGRWTFFKDHRGNTWHFDPTKWMGHPTLPAKEEAR